LVVKNYLEQMGRKKGYRLAIAAYQLAGSFCLSHRWLCGTYL